MTEPDRKVPRTPPRRTASAKSTASYDDARIVTPAAASSAMAQEKRSARRIASPSSTKSARRSLSLAATPTKGSEVVGKESHTEKEDSAVNAKKKLPFGGNKKPIEIPDNVQRVYHIVHKHTGSIGGNGSGGAIYGELTTGSMQKMTNQLM